MTNDTILFSASTNLVFNLILFIAATTLTCGGHFIWPALVATIIAIVYNIFFIRAAIRAKKKSPLYLALIIIVLHIGLSWKSNLYFFFYPSEETVHEHSFS